VPKVNRAYSLDPVDITEVNVAMLVTRQPDDVKKRLICLTIDKSIDWQRWEYANEDEQRQFTDTEKRSINYRSAINRLFDLHVVVTDFN
jgi:hypothetical protein